MKRIRVTYSEDVCLQLWVILCTMRLTELAIEECMIRVESVKSPSLPLADCSVKAKQQNDYTLSRHNYIDMRYMVKKRHKIMLKK